MAVNQTDFSFLFKPGPVASKLALRARHVSNPCDSGCTIADVRPALKVGIQDRLRFIREPQTAPALAAPRARLHDCLLAYNFW